MTDTKPRIGVYPGTFDPVTHGHMDMITRGGRLVDKLVVAVATNAGKAPLFTIAERVLLVEQAITAAGIAPERVAVQPFSSLLVDFVRQSGANMVLRGLRAVSDFDFEFQMAGMNYRLDPKIETVFLMASERHQFISSRFVKEIARLGGDISSFVPPTTEERLMARIRESDAS